MPRPFDIDSTITEPQSRQSPGLEGDVQAMARQRLDERFGQRVVLEDVGNDVCTYDGQSVFSRNGRGASTTQLVKEGNELLGLLRIVLRVP